ncbi:carbohydrate-binding protein [Pontibacter sp. G13]|uniref:carbohydrate-binding protein n=1 Tax=Pontibacter sp. G13 TaxID=3074898 RepID=UPI00288A27B3|nr:carbohydrate-binding protein [Pontibacter sp. G13]WNJ18286.1 carbohydrate-binding protein [Pontibacter sp. G13]
MKQNGLTTRPLTLAIMTLLAWVMSTAPGISQTLVWSQEFNNSTIDTDTWTYDFGTGCHEGVCDWGNQELQYYTSRTDNVYISGGSLIIEAKSETFDNKSFTSGRINTEGRVHFKYGTLEARIQIPNLQNGLWPAFWLLGVTGGGWPNNGEIDVAEWGNASGISAGVVNNRVNGAAHWEAGDAYAGYGTHSDFSPALNNDYHVYKMVWTPSLITCYMDDVEYYAIDISGGAAADLEEFHNMKYILLNLAVGGTFTGITNPGGISAPMPAQLKIDYVRLYQDSNGELWLGSQDAECGNYGVYTENTAVSEHINYGTEANLYLWNGLASNGGAAYEGTDVMSFSTTAGAWYGLGVSVEGRKNMSKFYGGSLKFHMKTNAPGTVRAGVSTGHGDSWIDLTSAYGYANDNQWHEVTIPFSDFYDLDLGAVKQMLMITGDVPTSSFDIAIDNVYYADGETCTSGVPVTGVAVSPTTGNLNVGSSLQLVATITPANASNQNVNWSSDNSSVATVDGNGLVTTVSAGSATITATTLDGSFTASASINVSSPSSSVLIQAEDYTSMSGIQTEGTADVGGGDNVGWINSGDWMEYSVNIPAAGTYTVHYRVASLSSGGNLTMTANGSTLDNTTFAATGSWQTWTTVSSTVTLNAGVQTIRITSNNNGWNINWFEFEPSGGSTPVNLFVEAEDYDAMSGIQTENTADAGGGENVGWIDAGDWLEYDISVPNAGSYSIDYRVASLSNGGDFTVTSDGNTVDHTTFSSTGSWQTWTTVSSTVNLPAGNQTIRITANTGGWNINWFEISSGGASRPVSIFELPEERIIAYPVPFGDLLHVTLPNTVDYEKVELLDLSGRILMTQQVQATELQWETANLPSGVYLLRAFRRLGAPEILKITK